MKKIFIAGSRKFYKEIDKLQDELLRIGIKVETADKSRDSEEDNLDNQTFVLLNAFKKIQEADVLYVYSKEGYIGKTVAMEIAYAHAMKKEIIAREEIKELSAQALITKNLNEEDLLNYCK